MTKEPTPDQTIEMLQRERDSLLDRVEGLRWMVDQMNKDSETMVYDCETHGPVYAAVAYTFGPRCADYDPGCPCCEAWEEYDGAATLRAENERLRAALRDMLRLVEDDEDDPAPYLIDVVCDRARAALDAFFAPKSGWAPTDGQKQLDAARYSGNIAHAPLPPAPGKEEA